MRRRVVVTGIGTVNALGDNVQRSWERLLEGTSGVRQIRFDFSTHVSPCLVAAKAVEISLEGKARQDTLSRARRLGQYAAYAVHATHEALAKTGLSLQDYPDRVGVLISSGIGGSEVEVDNIRNYGDRKSIRVISPFHIVGSIGNMASGLLAIEHQVTGPSLSIQTACASGNYSISVGTMMIQAGMIDVAICGGSENAINEFAIGSFCRMRALSTQYNDRPKEASRPFDKDRDGFVMGAGAGVLILEDYEKARLRNAPILCEVAGAHMSSDAYDMVAPEPTGKRIAECMSATLKQANLSIKDVDYINAHGTSTPLGDIVEAKAVHALLKAAAADEDSLHFGSTKSMVGHTLGAAGGIEAVFSIQAMLNNTIPPNINIDALDEAIELNPAVFNREAIQKPVNVVMSNSFGFGGHNSTVIFKRFKE